MLTILDRLFFVLAALMLLPLAAFGEAAPLPTDPAQLASQMLAAAQAHNWAAVVGLICGVLVWLLTKVPMIDSTLPAILQKWMPTIAASMSASGAVLLAGGKWLEALSVLVLTLIAALLPSPKATAAPAASPPA